MSNMKPLQLPGLKFRSGNRTFLLNRIDIWLSDAESSNRNHVVGFVNPHVYNLSCEHGVVRRFLNRADLVCVDGIGVKLALMVMHARLPPRVVAEHLFNELLTTSQRTAQAVLIGAAPGVAEKAMLSMNRRSAGLKIVDCLDGYQTADAYQHFLQQYKNISIVFIGAGSPGSENIAMLADEISTSNVIFHIGGGTLNTWAGLKKRGPRWMSVLGIEWLHRIVFEPHTRERYSSGAYLFLKNISGCEPTNTQSRNGDTT